MPTKQAASPVQKLWADLKKRIASQLVDAGYVKCGDGYWKTTEDGSAFTGVTFGATVGRSTKDRIDISFRMLGGLREFHPLAKARFGKEFKPSLEAAQFSAYIVDGQRGKRWTLTPAMSIDKVFTDISKRLASEGLPKAEAMLDGNQLLRALKAFDVNTADGAMDYNEAIRLLEESARRDPKSRRG